jgi:hypothetical protein
MNNTGKSSESRPVLPLPLVIGVSGHRDLREEDQKPLKAHVGQVFTELRNRYPSTPLVLLSGLAEGGDRLVAEVALEKGVGLIAPLPFPKALYEEDFQTQASRDEFNQLLQRAEYWFELPLLKDAPEEEVRQTDLARDEQYAQLGAYLVLHSQILIALWDGVSTNQVGGTSQVVEFCLEGVPKSYAPSHSPLDEPEGSMLYHIVTPRVINPTPVGKPFALHKLASASKAHEDVFSEQNGSGQEPGSTSDRPGKKQKHEKSHDTPQQRFDDVLESLNTFNSDVISLGSQLAQKQEQSKVSLRGTLDKAALPGALKLTLERYAEVFAIADSMAMYFRDQTRKTLLFLLSLFFIAVVFFNVFTTFSGDLVTFFGKPQGQLLSVLFLAFYLILLLLAYYIWYSRTNRRHFQNKYLDYRAVAEGVRVQFFWCLAGIGDSVALHYLRKQKSELDWIRNSMRVANLLCDIQSQDRPLALTKAHPNERYHLILKNWVDDQATYFTRSSARDQQKLESHERWIRRLFATGTGLNVLVLLLQVLNLVVLYPDWISAVPIVDLVIFFMSLALVLAALREHFTSRMAYSEQIKQYQRMSYLFKLASHHLKVALQQAQPQEAERVILELGKEALEENGDWVLLHRTRPISVPR